MNIRPKKILYADTGVKFSLNNLRGANWRQQVFNNYRLHLLDLLAKYGEADDYGSWLNEMLSRHSKLYNLAGGENGNWEDTAYRNDLVGLYQQDYRGGLGNDNLYKRYGSVLLSNDDKYDFNLTGIKTNQSTRYNIANPPSRTSGDYSREGYNYKVDNLYSAITDDRRLLGRKGDWDENSEDFKSWQKDLNSKGWETYLDTNDNYYKLRRLSNSNVSLPTPQKQTGTSFNPAEKLDPKNDFWQRLSAGFNKIAPDLLAAVRYAGNMHNNERVYNEMKQAIIPNLLGTYTTHRQIVGDEATKLAYYRRAAQGESKAAKAFTSDADRQMAYMMEAKRIGDELRAQGDLADNQEIRRTSDESNQHQWANALRANEVANANITELNKAKAARHQLAAQKHTADWTNTDLYLLGWESKFKLKQAEEKELERQLALLDTKEDLLSDTTLRDLRTAADDAYNAYSNETDATKKAVLKQKYEKAIKDYLLYNILKTRLNLRRQYEGVYTAKTGTKITKKDNSDKFLYKTSRDIVEHFRRMSKMTDDSRIRTMPKSVKLSSHPRKMLLGGVTPFTIYRPLGTGMETTAQTSTSTESKSSKDTSAKDKLDMIKELFKQVQGLPVDVSLVYLHMVGVFNKARAFGEEMSSDDIAAMYLSSMNEIARLKYSQKAYEDARNVAVANDAMNEIAVGANGEIALYDSENLKVKRGSLKQLLDSDGKLMALTNGQLLTMRAHSPNLAFDDQVFDIVNNGIGMSKIATHIKSIAGTIGSMETKIEGITKVESDKIKSGLRELAEAPEGYYKISLDKKDSSANINAALNYIYNILPKNYRTILELNSNGNGLKLIYSMLASQVSDFDKTDIDPLSGKAAKDANGKPNGKGGTDTPASVLFLLGNGYLETVEFNIGNSLSVKALGRFGILLDKEKNNLGLGSNLQDVSKSLFGPILDLDKATFGGTRLVSSGYSHIILNNSDCIGVDLPVKKDLSGNYVPDFLQLATIEKAEEKIHNNKITDPQQINQIYRELGLPDKFNSSGNVIQLNYRRFAGILVILDSKALKGGIPINANEISEADDKERELFIEEMKKSGNKDYDLSDGILWSSWGRDKLYKGTIFVPVREDIAAAYTSGGYPLDTDIPNNANLVAIMLYAPKTQQYLKTPPLSSLK